MGARAPLAPLSDGLGQKCPQSKVPTVESTHGQKYPVQKYPVQNPNTQSVPKFRLYLDLESSSVLSGFPSTRGLPSVLEGSPGHQY